MKRMKVKEELSLSDLHMIAVLVAYREEDDVIFSFNNIDKIVKLSYAREVRGRLMLDVFYCNLEIIKKQLKEHFETIELTDE